VWGRGKKQPVPKGRSNKKGEIQGETILPTTRHGSVERSPEQHRKEKGEERK